MSPNLYDIYHCVQRKTPDNGQRNCPKYVEFYSENKFEKLVHLVGFIIRIYHDARSPERQKSQMLLNVVTMLDRTNPAPWYVWRFCHRPVRLANKSQLKELWETGKDMIMHSVTPTSSDGQVQVLKLQYLLTYYMKHSLSGEAIGSSKFPAFYGIRRSITSSTSARHVSLNLSKIDPAHASASHLLKTPFIIILPPIPMSSKWSLSLRSTHQNAV